MGTKLLRGSGLILLALVMAGMFAGTALAQDGAKQVGVVIRFGDGSEHLQVVSVPADATALDVLKATGLEVVTVDYGGGFIALCGIGPDGCPADNCFCADESWAFWLLDEAAMDWELASVGLADHVPADGTVIGFSWTGWDESWNPVTRPPVYSFEELTAPAEVPEPATLALLGSGLAGLAGYVGLRRRAGR